MICSNSVFLIMPQSDRSISIVFERDYQFVDQVKNASLSENFDIAECNVTEH